jgi:hypothetical protein
MRTAAIDGHFLSRIGLLNDEDSLPVARIGE